MFGKNQLTPEIIQDGISFLYDTHLHQKRATYIPYCSYPHQEPWYTGTPHFAYYTQVNIPIYNLNCNFTTDPKCNLPNTIYIPTQGISTSPIIHTIIGRIIGKNGGWLKNLTTKTNLHYIWYNNTNKNSWGVFELWGRPEYLPYATYLLNKRISNVIAKYNIH